MFFIVGDNINRHGNSLGFTEPKKDKIQFKRNVNFSKNSTKEEMSIFTGESIQIMKEPKLKDKKSTPFKDVTKKRLTLKKFQEKKYLLPNSNLLGMLDDLL